MLVPPLHLDADVLHYLLARAQARGVSLGDLVNQLLRKDIELIETRRRPLVYTDFEDQVGEAAEVQVHGVSVGTDMDRFRMKARRFLKDHESHIAIQKLRRNEPLTSTDLEELERSLVEAGVAAPEDLERLDGGSACSSARWSGSIARRPRTPSPASSPSARCRRTRSSSSTPSSTT